MDFIDVFTHLCDIEGVSPTYALKCIGLSNSVYTFWKKNNSLPMFMTREKIASYFNVDVDIFDDDELARSCLKDFAESKLTKISDSVLKIDGRINEIKSSDVRVNDNYAKKEIRNLKHQKKTKEIEYGRIKRIIESILPCDNTVEKVISLTSQEEEIIRMYRSASLEDQWLIIKMLYKILK